MAQKAVGLDFKDQFGALYAPVRVVNLAVQAVGDGVLFAEGAKTVGADERARGGAHNVKIRTPETLAYLGLLWQRAPRSKLQDYVRALEQDLRITVSEPALCKLFSDMNLNLSTAPRVNPLK